MRVCAHVYNTMLSAVFCAPLAFTQAAAARLQPEQESAAADKKAHDASVAAKLFDSIDTDGDLCVKQDFAVQSKLIV